MAVIFARMRIGIVGWSATLKKEEEREYIQTVIDGLTNAAPQHSFALITDDITILNSLPVRLLQIPSITNYSGLRRWYNKTLPTLLAKESIDYLITINSGYVNTAIPQLSLLTSAKAPLLACKSWLSFLYKKYLYKSLQKAQNIAILSKPQQQELEKVFGVKANQISTVGYAVPATYQPADWQRREIFLQAQTGGREYFLYSSPFREEQFLLTLKAFSLFKKRQKSNLQLLVAGPFTISKTLQEKLDTYKYRQDVVLLNNLDSSVLPQLTACAYAVLFLQENTKIAHPVAAAMQCGVPVIGFENNEATIEAAGPAALYAQATPESLAEQMKLVYKDEALRQNLILHSQQRAALVDGKQAAQTILTLLMEGNLSK